MTQQLKDLVRRIEEFYVTTTGRLSYPTCQDLRDTDYPALVEELKRLKPEGAGGGDQEAARLAQALANLEAQLERYEAISRSNQSDHLSEVRSRLG